MPGDCGAAAQRLMRTGMPADTPCAIVVNASLGTQEILWSKLDEVSEVRTAAPKLMIIGDVARLQRSADHPSRLNPAESDSSHYQPYYHDQRGRSDREPAQHSRMTAPFAFRKQVLGIKHENAYQHQH
jgi:hypothetical protein